MREARSTPDFKPGLLDASRQRHMALSRWDNEGGAGLCGPQQGQIPEEALTEVPELTNTELVLLRVRVIALENLMIRLLAQGTDRQLELAREMAAIYLSEAWLYAPSADCSRRSGYGQFRESGDSLSKRRPCHDCCCANTGGTL